MLEDARRLEPAPSELGSARAIDELLQQRGVRVVGHSEWRRLDQLECESGKKTGKVREKFCSIEEMLAALELPA
jgi:hypothetical protein